MNSEGHDEEKIKAYSKYVGQRRGKPVLSYEEFCKRKKFNDIETIGDFSKRVLRMKPGQIAWSVGVLIWVNALPYLSRLSGGTDWVAEYLPDDGYLVVGLVFFHVFYSSPALPLIKSLLETEKPDLVWAIALIAVTLLTWFTHEGHDLSADAQAATVLVIMPLITMGIAFGIIAIGRKLRAKSFVRS